VPLCASIEKIISLFKSLPQGANKKVKKEDGNEVPLCTPGKAVKASFTLEAAVVIPIAAGFLAVILFWFRVLEVETEVYAALNYASRKTAAAGVMSEESAAELALAESLFLSKLSKAENAGNYLSAEQKLLLLAGSDLDGDYVDLIADYRIPLPIAFFSVKDIHIRQESRSRKWTGRKSEDSDQVYVYITETGTVYHLTKSCSYLDLSIRQSDISEMAVLRNAGGHKYYECEQCAAKNTGQSVVYVTDYGAAFHYTLECSGLKRSVKVVLKTEVGDRKLCSKCAKNAETE
jgi:hypothetical protein